MTQRSKEMSPAQINAALGQVQGLGLKLPEGTIKIEGGDAGRIDPKTLHMEAVNRDVAAITGMALESKMLDYKGYKIEIEVDYPGPVFNALVMHPHSKDLTTVAKNKHSANDAMAAAKKYVDDKATSEATDEPEDKMSEDEEDEQPGVWADDDEPMKNEARRAVSEAEGEMQRDLEKILKGLTVAYSEISALMRKDHDGTVSQREIGLMHQCEGMVKKIMDALKNGLE